MAVVAVDRHPNAVAGQKLQGQQKIGRPPGATRRVARLVQIDRQLFPAIGQMIAKGSHEPGDFLRALAAIAQQHQEGADGFRGRLLRQHQAHGFPGFFLSQVAGTAGAAAKNSNEFSKGTHGQLQRW